MLEESETKHYFTIPFKRLGIGSGKLSCILSMKNKSLGLVISLHYVAFTPLSFSSCDLIYSYFVHLSKKSISYSGCLKKKIRTSHDVLQKFA